MAHALLNGWTIAPIVNWFSGARVNGFVSGSSSGTTAGGVNGSGGQNRFGLISRNFFTQPTIQYIDVRLSRRFNIGEKAKIEVLGEVFNLFNRTQVTGVNSTLYILSGTNLNFNTSFGQTTGADSTLFRERQVAAGRALRVLNRNSQPFNQRARLAEGAPFFAIEIKNGKVAS